MQSTYFWLFLALSISGVALIWKNKRQYDRTDNSARRSESYWQHVRADSFDKILVAVGYSTLFAATVLFMTLDPSILALAIVGIVAVIWIKPGQRRK